jgi:hypothetical protein
LYPPMIVFSCFYWSLAMGDNAFVCVI